MNTPLSIQVLLLSVVLLAQGCARDKNVYLTPSEQPLAVADNPNVHLSDVLTRLHGRWVLEVADPREPNPTTMRLFALSDNTLSGRMNFAGPFEDTGVAATLVQSGDIFTLTLTDDELRPHDAFPKQRIFTGTFNAATNTLTLKSDTGNEDMKFEFTGGYSVKFSGNVYRCVLVHTPDGTSVPRRGGIANELALPGPAVPQADITSCRTLNSESEPWSRMSGTGGQ